jgi:phytanoyl-CoA hydroxylase
MENCMAVVMDVSRLSAEDLAELKEIPLDTRFELGEELTQLQKNFLAVHGFLIFNQVASTDEVQMILSEADGLGQRWIDEDTTVINGIPLMYGVDPEGKKFVQRQPFNTMFSEKIKSFVRDSRFEPIRRIFGEKARVGDVEKDGLVFNRYINIEGGRRPQLGWHTDGLRDLFYGRMPGPMLNVGLHFDEIKEADGGLRLIPGSHNQGFLSMCFKKAYFISHKADPKEITVETKPGDLTIHDGRLWHRVARSNKFGWDSLRRTMFVPYLTGPYEPKDENSKMPFYHRLDKLIKAG